MYPYSRLVKDLRLGWAKRLPGMNRIRLNETNLVILLSIFTGIGAGFASVLFRKLLHYLEFFFFEIVYYQYLAQIHPYTLPLIPVFGAILLIPFSRKFPGEINGYGMPKFLIAVNLRKGFLKTRTIFIKIVTSSITISSGGAAGVEGPIAQIGGAVGSVVARFFELSPRHITTLVSCGAAAGIAAQFNAPIAGVLFAQEIILLGVFQLEVFSAIIIASGLATAVSRAFYTSAPIFGTFAFDFNFVELPFYLVLGLFMGFFSSTFIRFFYSTVDYFASLKLHEQLKPILGALLVGCLGLIHWGVLSDGYAVITSALTNPYQLGGAVLFMLFGLKFLATSLTLGSGNVGGVFAPCLFLGATLGGAYGVLIDYLFPNLGISPGTYAFVGMGTFLAAAVHAPLTSIFLLFELTSDYQVIIPIMLASVVGLQVSRGLCADSIDTFELSRQGVKLQNGREVSVLQSIEVREVFQEKFEFLHGHLRFSDLLDRIREFNSQYFPVLNRKHKLVGILSLNDIQEFLLEEGVEDIVIAADLMERNPQSIRPEQSLVTAMEKFSKKDVDILPVVDPDDPKKILGVLKKHDVITAYNKAMLIEIAETGDSKTTA